MKKLLKKVSISTIIMSISAFILPIIQGIITHKLEDFNYFNMVKNTIIFIFKCIVIVMTFSIPLWIILIILSVIIIYKYYSNIYNYYNKNKKLKLYKTQCYEGLIYTWEYSTKNGKNIVEKIKPICECGCDLMVESTYKGKYKYKGYLVCPSCHKGYKNNFEKNKDAVKRLVIFKYNKMIDKIQKYVNLKGLTKVEKNIIKLFYDKRLKIYTSEKIILDFRKYNTSIENLIERGILKRINNVDVVCSYSGGLFKLTDEAIKSLNK